MLLTFQIHILLSLLVSNCTIWCLQCEGLTLQSAVAHLKVKCGKMLTSLSLPSQHQGHYCICIAVSLSISLSFSFTLWMVHLAYMTEWIHNPGQFKIPWGPVGIKWNHISRKDCCTAICSSSLLFGSSSFMWLTNTAGPWTHMTAQQGVSIKDSQWWFTETFTLTLTKQLRCD